MAFDSKFVWQEGEILPFAETKTESVRAGFDEAIMLDHHGNVSECSGENIFIVRNGIFYTPPRNSVLEGLTLMLLFPSLRMWGLR